MRISTFFENSGAAFCGRNDQIEAWKFRTDFAPILNRITASLTDDYISLLTHICKLSNISSKICFFDPVMLETDASARPILARVER
jgi:hypothetical protein